MGALVVGLAVQAAGVGGGSVARSADVHASVAAGPLHLQRYVDPPPVGSYPARQEVVQAWIDALDVAAIRAHGWDVWASITSSAGPADLPVWETWHSGHELFEIGPAASPAERRAFRDFGRAHRTSTTARRHRIPIDPAERRTAFNRYSASVAQYIWDQGYNKAATLDRINDEFDRRGTPVADRAIQTSPGPVDARSIVLKPVFQFISGSEPTAVPYWAGISVQTTTSLANPEPHTWRQCVVVDPTGSLPVGSVHVTACNAEPPAPHPVVALADFYRIVLTQEDVDAFSQFAASSGDEVGKENLTDLQSVLEMVKPGNIALLMAMHATTKEIPNWTWQTYWWARHPLDPVYGRDRPSSIPRPWSHYNMDTAYYMVAPSDLKDGTPLIAFNPYLETNLQGTVATADGRKIEWTGVDSNCMSCHRMAAWKPNPDPQPGQSNHRTPGYRPGGLISPDDPEIFAGYTKLDFLWSLTRAR